MHAFAELLKEYWGDSTQAPSLTKKQIREIRKDRKMGEQYESQRKHFNRMDIVHRKILYKNPYFPSLSNWCMMTKDGKLNFFDVVELNEIVTP
jgi:hypothetical protein